MMETISIDNLIPKVNPNIVICHRDNECIISLKGSNFHLKISSQTFKLISLIDNNKNIGQIIKEYNNSCQNHINKKLAYDLFYNKLGHYNIIENSKSNFDDTIETKYLRLNFILLKPSITKVLSKPLLFLFSKVALRLLISFYLIISLLSVIANYNEILKSIDGISVEYFAFYFCIMLFSSLLHELGHVSAAYKFGGIQSGIGVGFYLFSPVMYANVSCAWKFDLGKRLIVNLAGIYFELIFSTILLILSFVTGFKQLLIIPSIILIKTLLNLNPFFRTDGYWVLSDAIRIPNLRSKSNELMKRFLKFNEVKRFKTRDVFLIIYALISNTFIFIFLFYIFIMNPNALITFPIDIYEYIVSIMYKKNEFSLSGISHLLIPVAFYILLIRFSINFIKKHRLVKKMKVFENQKCTSS